VRNVNDPVKVAHLHKIADESPGKLVLFEADLLKDSSFDAAMQGCELVIHTASVWSIDLKMDPDLFIKPAIDGTRNVLNSVNKTGTVKRVVLTSSSAAIFGDCREIQGYPGGVATEESWNTTSSPKHLPYSYSKTMAEKLAWEMHKEQNRWDLVAINPTWVFGPSLSKRRGIQTTGLLILLTDKRSAMGTVPFSLGIVDVRDVAEAHIKAGFQPESSGRHILYNEQLWGREIAAVLDQHFGSKFTFPKSELPKWLCWLIAPAIPTTREFVAKSYGYKVDFDNTRSIKQLGITYRPVETTLVDHFNQIVDDGLMSS
jgi:nucleoside-diphosphate-sugar epimerase